MGGKGGGGEGGEGRPTLNGVKPFLCLILRHV